MILISLRRCEMSLRKIKIFIEHVYVIMCCAKVLNVVGKYLTHLFIKLQCSLHYV